MLGSLSNGDIVVVSEVTDVASDEAFDKFINFC